MVMDRTPLTRRSLLETAAGLGLSLAAGARASAAPTDAVYRISLAQWSLHRDYFGPSLAAGWEAFGRALHTAPDSVLQGKLDPRDFPRLARELGLEAVEYVNTFFFGHARDQEYLRELDRRAKGEGVKSVLIMCDAEGDLGHPDTAERARSVENHVRWLEAAEFLGCHAIRVNAASRGTFGEQQRLAADGLRQLCERAEPHGLSVLVENHGGLSSNGGWLAGVMRLAAHPRLGTLPDFGNFVIGTSEAGVEERYDRYQGVAELMPWARAVSAKSYDFDAAGEETAIDFHRMLRIVVDAGYRGWVGIEYEGTRLDSRAGILATRTLLERVRSELPVRN